MSNPWDAATAKLFASLGFDALATTSFGLANGALTLGARILAPEVRAAQFSLRLRQLSMYSMRVFVYETSA